VLKLFTSDGNRSLWPASSYSLMMMMVMIASFFVKFLLCFGFLQPINGAFVTTAVVTVTVVNHIFVMPPC